jgi:mono/diheme cytochrome c family protein/sRNA-binding regulator protein Hfq
VKSVRAILVLVAAINLHAQTPAITTGYPQRPPADPAVLERGRLLYSTNCAFCHGNDARGGEDGSNLLRSEIVLNDKSGELLGDVLRNGLSTMPKFEFNREQTADLAAFIHSFRVGGYDVSRLRPQTIVVGDPKAGEAYFKAKCASCHDVAGDLKGFAARINDSRVMQQTWLNPGARGTRPSRAATTRVTVTLASGQQLEGQLVRIDDFIVTLAGPDATQYTVRREGQTPKVEVRDPLQPHKDLLRIYSDKDIHNVTAYLGSLE